MKHFLYIPFTGLGLYGGFRGNRWLRNRISVFKHFVVPSLQAQTNQNFSIWVSWRREERTNPQVIALYDYLTNLFPGRVVFTYSGCCFWDDKYPDDEAHIRLAKAIHDTSAELINHLGDGDVIMTIQPSDDCFNKGMVDEIQTLFKNTDLKCIGYQHGYIMDYLTGELREYNPKTNPPFVSIRFPKEVFIDPMKHIQYTALKHDIMEE